MLISQPSPKPCENCRKPFIPAFSTTQVCCSMRCASAYVRRLRLSKEKQERAQTKERKAAIKTRREWIAEAQQAVNRYVRLRDLYAGYGCISCGASYELRYGGAFDAGHFRSVGSAPHLRFFLPQIRLQCVRCNRHLGGNAIAFRGGLAERIGVLRVEEIEAMQGVAKWDVPYLRRLKSIMAKRANRLEKRHAV